MKTRLMANINNINSILNLFLVLFVLFLNEPAWSQNNSNNNNELNARSAYWRESEPKNSNVSLEKKFLDDFSGFISFLKDSQHKEDKEFSSYQAKMEDLIKQKNRRNFSFQDNGEEKIDFNSPAKEYFKEQTTKNSAAYLSSHSKSFNLLNKGFSFDFNLGHIFNAPENKNKNLKYRLVTKEISLDKNSTSLASISDNTIDDQLKFASKAKVNWTIGPVFEEDNAKIVSPLVLPQTEPSIFSPDFKMNLGITDLKQLAGDQEAPPPGLKISLQQKSGLYSLFYQSNQENTDRFTHQLSVPIFEACSLGRKFDLNGNTSETFIHNLLLYSYSPQLNISYLHKRSTYKTELKKSATDLEWLLSAEVPAVRTPENEQTKTTYSAGLNKNF